MKYDTVIYCFYSAKKGIDFGKSLFVLEGIKPLMLELTSTCHRVSEHGTTYLLAQSIVDQYTLVNAFFKEKEHRLQSTIMLVVEKAKYS